MTKKQEFETKKRLFKRWKRVTVENKIRKALARNTPNRRIVDTANNILNIAYASTWKEIGLLSAIAQGDDLMNRTGRTIKIKYLELNFYIKPDPDANFTDQGIRHVLTLCNKRDTTPLTGTSVYAENKIVDLPESGIIRKYYDKFKMFNFWGTKADNTIGYAKPMHIVIKKSWKKGLKVNYTSGAEIDKELYISYISNIAGAIPVITGGFYRLVFEDA